MIVGTPGTGIGGLFYLILAAWMPVHHAWDALKGRAIPGGWKIVVSSLAQGGAMIGSLCAEAWVIKAMFGSTLNQVAFVHVGATKVHMADSMNALAPTLALAPMAALVFVLLCVHVARLLGMSARARAARRALPGHGLRMPAPATPAPAVVAVKES